MVPKRGLYGWPEGGGGDVEGVRECNADGDVDAKEREGAVRDMMYGESERV